MCRCNNTKAKWTLNKMMSNKSLGSKTVHWQLFKLSILRQNSKNKDSILCSCSEKVSISQCFSGDNFLHFLQRKQNFERSLKQQTCKKYSHAAFIKLNTYLKTFNNLLWNFKCNLILTLINIVSLVLCFFKKTFFFVYLQNRPILLNIVNILI